MFKVSGRELTLFFGFLWHFIGFQDTRISGSCSGSKYGHGDSHWSIYQGAQNIVLVQGQRDVKLWPVLNNRSWLQRILLDLNKKNWAEDQSLPLSM